MMSRLKRNLLFAVCNFICMISMTTARAEELFSQDTRDSEAKIITSTTFEVDGLLLKCKGLWQCYYLHSSEPLSFVEKDPQSPFAKHEYDYVIDGNAFDRTLVGSYVSVTGSISGGNTFSNVSIEPVSVASVKNGNALKILSVSGIQRDPAVLGYDKAYTLTGILVEGMYEIAPDYRRIYYYIHLDDPVTFDPKSAEGILRRQYDIGIRVDPKNRDYEMNSIKRLVGKKVSIYGYVGFSRSDESLECCSLGVYIKRVKS